MKKIMMAFLAVWMLCIHAPAMAQAAENSGIAAEAEMGVLGIVKVDEEDTEKGLPGALFGIYETQGGKKAGELLTGEEGRAVVELPAGEYTLRELAPPEGYALSEEGIHIFLQPGNVWEVAVTGKREEEPSGGAGGDSLGSSQENSQGDSLGKPEEESGAGNQDSGTGSGKKASGSTGSSLKGQEQEGTLQIANAGEKTGEKLSGAVFDIYGSSGQSAGSITVCSGSASLLLPAGEYTLQEKEAPEGYRIEKARIAFTVLSGDTTLVEITSERDETYTLKDKVPQTGAEFPSLWYVLAAACGFLAVVFCIFSIWFCLIRPLWRRRKQQGRIRRNKKKRKGEG